MKIAIYGNRHQADYINEIMQLLNHIALRGDKVIMHNKLRDYLRELAPEFADYEVEDGAPDCCDVAVSIGGDGTFLRTAEWIGQGEVPIIGVNTGHLGFLAPFNLQETCDAIDRFAAGEAEIEERTLLQVELLNGDLGTWPYALNEVTIQKRDNASMITVDTRINQKPLADYLCDGLIVSTPTGSTGYNLSVGGPIVEPSAPNFVISPIAAHTLTMRPLIVDDNSLIEAKTTSRASTYRVSLDGRAVTLPAGVSLFLSKAPFVVKIVRKPAHNFFATLRDKLLWGAR